MATFFKLISFAFMLNEIIFIAAIPSHPKREIESVRQNEVNSKGKISSVFLDQLRRKKRQLGCARCYDDKYTDEYSASSGLRDRYYGSEGTYSGRSNNWYQPKRYDSRYGDRGRYSGDPYYYYYSSHNRDRLDNRYPPRTHDQLSSRGYDYQRHGYDDRRYYDDGRNYGYDRNIDNYYGNRKYYDNYYDHVRSPSTFGYDRRGYYGPEDYYNRRYNSRNYRPLDDTYRGQSGFDNSGRGYYFADNERASIAGNDGFYDSHRGGDGSSWHGRDKNWYSPSRYEIRGPAYLPDHESYSPCSRSKSYQECHPSSSSTSSSSVGGFNRSRLENSSYPVDSVGKKGSNSENDKNNYAGSWSYIRHREENNVRNLQQNSDKESTSYSSRPSRPLGNSYLFDRDSSSDLSKESSSTSAKTDINQDGIDSSSKPMALSSTQLSPGNSSESDSQNIDNKQQ